MQTFLSYVAYELGALVRVQRRSLAVLVFLPFVYTLLFGGMFYPNVVTQVPIGIVNLDEGPQGRDIVRELGSVPEVRVDLVATDEAAGQEALRQQSIRALVIIPPTFSHDITQYQGAKVAVLVTNTNTLLGGTALKAIQSVIGTYNVEVQTQQAMASGLTRPMAPQIAMSLRSLYNSTGGYEDFFLAALIVHALQIGVVFTVGPMWYLDKHRRRQELRRHGLAVLAAKAAVYTVLETLILLVCLTGSSFFFGLTMRPNVVELLLLLTAFSWAMTNLALFVGSAVKKIGNTITYPLFYIMPSVLFSGAIWPRYSMDSVSLGLSYIMPIGYSANTLRDLLLRGTAPAIGIAIAFLSLYGLTLVLVAWWILRRRLGQEERR